MAWRGRRSFLHSAVGLSVAGTLLVVLRAHGAELVGRAALPAPATNPAQSLRELTVMLPGKVPLVLVRIPAGMFTMGSPVSERNRVDDETPHQVTLTRDFYIGKHEVTQAQWQAIMGSNPSGFAESLSCPVEQVSWNEINGPDGFLARLNRHLATTGQAGAGQMRLPTEAEWERAARGGTSTRFSYGEALECRDSCKPCAAHERHIRWCGNNASGSPDPVGSRQPNPFGLFDAHGNVAEWVQDLYGPYASSPQTDPAGPTRGPGRVVRGGRNDSNPQNCRSAYRSVKSADEADGHTGLRVAVSK
jgi:formylglycine-generating enzyme required for sulfatase activity